MKKVVYKFLIGYYVQGYLFLSQKIVFFVPKCKFSLAISKICKNKNFLRNSPVVNYQSNFMINLKIDGNNHKETLLMKNSKTNFQSIVKNHYVQNVRQ